MKNLTDYGAFVDLGGIDGLLHVSDMSLRTDQHPSETIHVGDEITVKILKFDRDKERISLGMKQLASKPWETVEEHYPMAPRDRPCGQRYRLRRLRRTASPASRG